MNDINIGSGHVTVSGQTQHGKSYFVKKVLLGKYQKNVFYDLKHDPAHEDIRIKYGVVKSVKDLKKFFEDGGKTVIYQPPFLDNKEAIAHFDSVCKYIFSVGNITIFNDEAAGLTSPSNISKWYYVLITQGLSRGCNCINITQSPTLCHNVILSQSDYFILFRHNVKSHRDKLAGIIGEAGGDRCGLLPKYRFIFVNPDKSYMEGQI